MKRCEQSGKLLARIKDMIATFESEEAARAIYAAATFEVTEMRPLVDFGQGWKRSV
jgi:hypothetical protein